MVQMHPASSQSIMRATLSHSIGKGLADFATNYYANKAIEKVMNEPGLRDKPLSERYDRLEQALRPFGEYGQNILAKRLGVEQQRSQEAEAVKAEALQKKQAAAVKKMFPNMQGIEDLSPEMLKVALQQQIKNQGKIDVLSQEAKMLGLDLPGGEGGAGSTYQNQPSHYEQYDPNILDQEPLSSPGQGFAQQPAAQMQPNMQFPMQQPQQMIPPPSQMGRPSATPAPQIPQGQPQVPPNVQPAPQQKLPYTDQQILKASLLSNQGPSRAMIAANEAAIASQKIKQGQFEPESEKLNAKRQSELYDSVFRGHQAAQSSTQRLKPQLQLAKSKQLSTPAMVKTMNAFGLPLGILNNPLTEAYQKLENDFIKDLSDYFPGAIRVYEAQTYMKTIPTLMNSDEGKELVIENLLLQDEGKELVFQEAKQILKENNGKVPPNFDVLLDERSAPKVQEIGEKINSNMQRAIESYGPKVTMYDEKGKRYQVPQNQLDGAIKDGLKF